MRKVEGGSTPMDECIASLMSYFEARLDQLKSELAKSRDEVAALRTECDKARSAAATPATPGKIAGVADGLNAENGVGGAPIGDGAGDPMTASDYIHKAASEVAAALHPPPGQRPDLDIMGLMFLRSIRSGGVAAVKKAVADNPKLLTMRSISRSDTMGFNALHCAAQEGKVEVVRALLDLGMDPFETDVIGRTALHLAAMKMHIGVVTLLIERMGDVRGEEAPTDASGVTPAGYSGLADTSKDRKLKDRQLEAFKILHKPGDKSISPSISRSGSRPRTEPRPRNTGRSKLYTEQMIRHYSRLPAAATSAILSPRVQYGSASIPGYRVTMEDAVCLAHSLGKSNNMALFAVFDGHGGPTAADFCSQHICEIFEATEEVASGAAERDGGALSIALRNTCLRLDSAMSQLPQFQFRETVEREATGTEPALIKRDLIDHSGTTATIVVVTPRHIAVANVGDSRTIMIEEGEVVLATRDQRHPDPACDDDAAIAFWEGEAARIEAAGGAVNERGRVVRDPNSSDKQHLAMSRALGDFDFKVPNQVIIAEPDVLVRERHTAVDQLFVLACDGIWDVMSNEKCKDHVMEAVANTTISASDSPHASTLDQICKDLAMKCIESMDNLSVVMIRLPAAEGAAADTLAGSVTGPDRVGYANPARHQPVQRNLMQQLDEAMDSV